MSELLAVLSNPKRRRRKKKSGGFQRAQQLTARRARRRRRSSAIIQSVTSHGRPVSRSSWRASGFRRNAYRRNPKGGGVRAISKGVGQDLVAALAGAAGGVALDFVMRPLPLVLKAGPLNHLVRGAAAIGLGILGQAVRVPYAGELARGAMTVTLYNAVRQYVLLPRGLGELSDDDVAELSAVTTDEDGMSEVISLPASSQLGEVFEMNGLGEHELDEVYES